MNPNNSADERVQVAMSGWLGFGETRSGHLSTKGSRMRRDAWVELPHHRYDRVWDRFDEAFEFRPSVRPEDWPSFREPTPSMTWRISEQLEEFQPLSDPRAAPYNLALLHALLACVPEDEPVLALDWQHTA